MDISADCSHKDEQHPNSNGNCMAVSLGLHCARKWPFTTPTLHNSYKLYSKITRNGCLLPANPVYLMTKYITIRVALGDQMIQTLQEQCYHISMHQLLKFSSFKLTLKHIVKKVLRLMM